MRKILVVVVAVAASACGDETIQRARPDLQVLPNPMEFGPRRVNLTSTFPLRLTALTSAPIELFKIAIEGTDAAHFRLQEPLPIAVQSQSHVDVEVKFTPDSERPFEAKIVIESNDENESRIEVDLSGEGKSPRIEVVPGCPEGTAPVGNLQPTCTADAPNLTLTLQAVVCPQDSIGPRCWAQGTFSIKNSGQVRLTITNRVEFTPLAAEVAFGTIDASGHLITVSTQGTGIEPDDSVTVPVVFRPVSATTIDTRVKIVSDDPLKGEVNLNIHAVGLPNQKPEACIKVQRVQRRNYSGGEFTLEDVPLADYVSDDAPQVRPGYIIWLTSKKTSTCTLDPELDPLRYTWSLPTRPELSRAEVQPLPKGACDVAEDGACARIEIDAEGQYALGLSVKDSLDQVGTTTMQIDAIPKDDLSVQLSWVEEAYAGVDIDLHLVGPGGNLWCVLDTFFDNPNGDWGVQGVEEDNPRLNRDDFGASGRLESITLERAFEGTYRAFVHYFRSPGAPATPVRPKVRIRVLDAEPVQFIATQDLDEVDDLWEVATITWPAASASTAPVVTAVDAYGTSSYGGVVEGCAP